MNWDWLSFEQAIADLNLELLLTTGLVFVLFVVGLLVGRWSLRHELKLARYNQKDTIRQIWWNNFWQGISTELFGAVVTTLGFGLILVVFQQYQAVQSAKVDLILQMGSPDNAFAIEAIRIARQKEWLLYDSALSGVDLKGADLTDANLSDVYLENADLIGAKLTNANLSSSNLVYSYLSVVDLRNANLRRANLTEADLWNADLTGADLTNANLFGVYLAEAFLPDGTKWTSETDMTRFTDPKHPDYQSTLEKINELRADMELEPIE